MRPYVTDDPNGSLRAAVASVHELPLSEVPELNMASHSPTWIQQLNAWSIERFGAKWVCAFLLQDEEGNAAPQGIWTPPGFYIEGCESDDGEVTLFTVCCGQVTMHQPYHGFDGKITAKMRLWLVIVDPAKAWPQEGGGRPS